MCELCLFVPMLSWGRREVGDVTSPVTLCPAWSGAQEESMLQETPNCRSRSLLERICIYRVPPDSRLWQALGSSTAQSGSRLLLSRPPSPPPPSRHVSGPPFLSTAPWPPFAQESIWPNEGNTADSSWLVWSLGPGSRAVGSPP